MMGGNFGELPGGDGARGARGSEDDFRGVREEKAGDFIDGLVAEGGVEQPDFAVLEILLQEMGEFAGGTGIVSAIHVNVSRGLQFFEASWPDGVGDSLRDGVIRNAKAAVLKWPRGSDAVQRVLELETAGETRGELETFATVGLIDPPAYPSVLTEFP